MLNVSPNTLRAWERRFGFPKPQRSPGKHRLFTHGEVAALRDALQEGLSISSAVSRAREGLAADSNSLVGALVSYERERADVAIEAALALRSVERSVEEVLLPTLEEIARRYGDRVGRVGVRGALGERLAAPRAAAGTAAGAPGLDRDRRRLARRARPRCPVHPGARAVLRARRRQGLESFRSGRRGDRRRGRRPPSEPGRARRRAPGGRHRRALGLRGPAGGRGDARGGLPPRRSTGCECVRPARASCLRGRATHSGVCSSWSRLSTAQHPGSGRSAAASLRRAGRRPRSASCIEVARSSDGRAEQSEGEPTMARKARRLALAVVPNATPDVGPSVSFCSHCGGRPAVSEPASRVCSSCGLGAAAPGAAPRSPRRPATRSWCSTPSLSVCAVSRRGRAAARDRETDAVNRHVTELLVPADAEAQSASNLAVAVTWAARGDGQTSARRRPPDQHLRSPAHRPDRELRAARRRR